MTELGNENRVSLRHSGQAGLTGVALHDRGREFETLGEVVFQVV